MRTFYISILISILSCSNNDKKHIGIQALGEFKTPLIDTLALTISDIYDFKVSVLNSKDIPAKTYINIKSPRYRADKLIQILKHEKPDSLDYIIGLISKDISTSKKDKNGNILLPKNKYEDWGVFGLGYRPGVSSIVSTYRYRNNQKEFISRFKKICIHEIGHNLGLKHCSNLNCVMRDAAESIKTIDQVKLNLCNNCKKEIQ